MLCTRCKADKPDTEFRPVQKYYAKREKSPWCRTCCNSYTAQWRKTHLKPEVKATYRRTARLRMYGLTHEAFLQIMESQNGVCAICHCAPPEGRELDVDHCHATGVVRGLLCGRCNKVLGHMEDSKILLERAITYLGGTK